MKRTAMALVAALVLWAGVAPAQVAQQIGAGDTALLFGGTDAEGGIGDWYVSNGVVQAIVDNVGVAQDLVGVLPPGTEPPIQSEAAFTGGNLLDLGLVGQNNDQLSQMFTVGGLSTTNFILNTTATANGTDTVDVQGRLVFAPLSVAPSLCVDIDTKFQALGSDPFLTITTTATNHCSGAVGLSGYLDAFVWTLRGLIPFSGGGTVFAGFGFNHPAINFSNPAAAIELPLFMGAPGTVRPADGIMDPAHGTSSDEVSYGLIGVETQKDNDGAGPNPPVVVPVNGLFGVSSTLVTALGNVGVGGTLSVNGTLSYKRRIYVGARNDVRSVSNGIFSEYVTRGVMMTGTISGDVDGADDPNIEASILATRIGHCSGNTAISCKTTTPDCTGNGSCVDPAPGPGLSVNTAISHLRTDATGAFSGAVLPRGDYELTVSSPERDDVVVSPVTVGAGDTPVVIAPLSARATVTFAVREKASRLPPLPAKLTFKGVTPTPDPRFHYDLKAKLGGNDIHPETFGGTQPGTGTAVGQGNVVYATSGTGSIQLRPGTYDVYVSRGMEYSVVRKTITVASGGTANVDAKLKRIIRTKNAMSGDFHVHSGRSLDASAPLRDRVAAFAGEGVEVMVSTDHDKHLDYSSLITAAGLDSRMRSIVGDEVTGSLPNPPQFPNSFGHINAWPFAVEPDQPRDGTIQDEFVAPNWLYKRMRDKGAEVIQYNHPRASVSGLTVIGYFNNIGCNRCANAIDTACVVDTDCPAVPAPQDCTCVGYQPDRPITMAPNDILLDDGILGPGSTANPSGFNNFDFDVVEIANGATTADFKGFRQVRRDWLSLLNQGIYRPGTGVSDSHRITVEHAGWARTYVRGAGDNPASVNVTTFDDQVKAGSMFFTSGPYVEFTVRAPATGATTGLGGMLATPDGRVGLKIKVTSPAWIPVEEVRIIANGFVIQTFDATTIPAVRPVPANFQGTGQTTRFSRTLIMNVSQDTYLIVEAGAKIPADFNTLPTPPAILDAIVPGVVPEAVTNPVFVDRDGNNTFDPPGLPVMTVSNQAAELPKFAQVKMEIPGTTDGFWAWVRQGIERFTARFTGTAVAQNVPGEMTGVTKEDRAKAAAKGEYFPMYEGFTIPAEQADALQREADEKSAAAAAAAKAAETK